MSNYGQYLDDSQQPGGSQTMTTHANSGGGKTNQERIRVKLKAETLAKRLADAYDPTNSAETNSDALKQVIVDELHKVRQSLEQDEN